MNLQQELQLALEGSLVDRRHAQRISKHGTQSHSEAVIEHIYQTYRQTLPDLDDVAIYELIRNGAKNS